MSNSSDDARMLPETFVPLEQDVICGWARQNHQHGGNQRFRELIEEHAEQYLAAKTKLDKTQVIVAVIDKIREDSPNGGFVKKDFYSGRWFEIGNEKARDKVGHAIRKASEILERKKTGKAPTSTKNKGTSAATSGGRKRKSSGKKLNQPKKRQGKLKEAEEDPRASPLSAGNGLSFVPSLHQSSAMQALHSQPQQHRPPALRMDYESTEYPLQRPNFFPSNLTNSLNGSTSSGGDGGAESTSVTRTGNSLNDYNGSLLGRAYLPAAQHPQAALLDMQIPSASILSGYQGRMALSAQLQSRMADHAGFMLRQQQQGQQQGESLPNVSAQGGRGNDMTINAATAEGLIRDEMSRRANHAALRAAASRMAWPQQQYGGGGNGGMNHLLTTNSSSSGTSLPHQQQQPGLVPGTTGALSPSDLATLRYLGGMTAHRPFLTGLDVADLAAGNQQQRQQLLEGGFLPTPASSSRSATTAATAQAATASRPNGEQVPLEKHSNSSRIRVGDGSNGKSASDHKTLEGGDGTGKG